MIYISFIATGGAHSTYNRRSAVFLSLRSWQFCSRGYKKFGVGETSAMKKQRSLESSSLSRSLILRRSRSFAAIVTHSFPSPSDGRECVTIAANDLDRLRIRLFFSRLCRSLRQLRHQNFSPHASNSLKQNC